MTEPARSRRRFRFTLTWQIVAGLVVGAVIGAIAPEDAVKLDPVAKLFLNLIKMIVAPLLLTTLVTGIASIGAKSVGRLGLKAIIWFEVATTVALGIGLLAANLARPGVGVDLSHASAASAADLQKLPKAKTTAEFIVDIVPQSVFDALARNQILQILVFSVMLGLAISAAGHKARALKELAEAGAEAMFKLVGFVMRFAPFGVGAAFAVTLGKYGLEVLIPLVKCIAALYAALIVFFVLLFVALKLLTGVHLRTFARAIREPALIAFTTSTSDAALPRAMEALEQLGVPRRIVSFVVPSGYAFNLDGSTLYLALAVVFVGQISGADLSVGKQLGMMLFLMLSTKGVAGVPRAALVVLGGTLTAFDLSPLGLQLLFGIDALMDMGRTCVNVVGNCVATVVVASWEKALPADAPVFGPGRAAAGTLPTATVERAGDAVTEDSPPSAASP